MKKITVSLLFSKNEINNYCKYDRKNDARDNRKNKYEIPSLYYNVSRQSKEVYLWNEQEEKSNKYKNQPEDNKKPSKGTHGLSALWPSGDQDIMIFAFQVLLPKVLIFPSSPAGLFSYPLLVEVGLLSCSRLHKNRCP